MDFKELKGKYGWVSIDQIQDDYFEQFIYPPDLNWVKEYNFKDPVFKCIGVLKEDYLILESTEITVRLRMEIFRIMPAQPLFMPLEKVKYLSSKGKIEFGIIKGIGWHNKERRHIYNLEVKGKIKGRRYHDEDFQKT